MTKKREEKQPEEKKSGGKVKRVAKALTSYFNRMFDVQVNR